jgi:hypothetical protein
MSSIKWPPVQEVIDPDDHDKWIHELKRPDHPHDPVTAIIYKEVAMISANAAIRNALRINVGAAITMLAFIAGFGSWNIIPVSELAKIASGLLLFTSGVALASGSAALAYFGYYCIATRFAIAFQFVASLCALSSLVAFTTGTIIVHDAAVGLQSPGNASGHLVRSG